MRKYTGSNSTKKYRMRKHRGTAELKYRMGKHRGTAEHTSEWNNTEVQQNKAHRWENTQAQQNKVLDGEIQRYSRTKYRMRKHTGTAEQSTERENTQLQQS